MQLEPKASRVRPVVIGPGRTRSMEVVGEGEGDFVVCITNTFPDGHEERDFVCGNVASRMLDEHRALLAVR